MFVFIRAQDIREMEIGLSSNRELLFCSVFETSPEEHLSLLNQVLEKNQVQKEDIEGIYIVTGPGSFTASRVSITIANTLAYTLDVPVFEIQNQEKKTISVLFDQVSKDGISPKEFAKPFYDRPPMITQEKC